MPNLSRRLTIASEKSAQATRRIAAAEQKIARALVDLLRDEDSEGTTAQGSFKKTTPTKKTPQK